MANLNPQRRAKRLALCKEAAIGLLFFLVVIGLPALAGVITQ